MHEARRRSASQVTTTPRHHHRTRRNPATTGETANPLRNTDSANHPRARSDPCLNRAPQLLPLRLRPTKPDRTAIQVTVSDRPAPDGKPLYLQGLSHCRSGIGGHPFRRVSPSRPYSSKRVAEVHYLQDFTLLGQLGYAKSKAAFPKSSVHRLNMPWRSALAGKASRYQRAPRPPAGRVPRGCAPRAGPSLSGHNLCTGVTKLDAGRWSRRDPRWGCSGCGHRGRQQAKAEQQSTCKNWCEHGRVPRVASPLISGQTRTPAFSPPTSSEVPRPMHARRRHRAPGLIVIRNH